MMSWFDEPLENLQRAIDGIAALGATDLVAVDGAYENFPNGDAHSPHQQFDFIRAQAWNHRLALTIHRPQSVWVGDEVAKRQFMLDLALAVSDPGDWLMIYDCDWEVLECKVDTHVLLGRTPHDVLDVTLTTAPDSPEADHPLRMFMRAIPGMRMGTNHYTYLYPDGRKSTVMPNATGEQPHWNRVIRVLHRHYERDQERHDRQAAYYEVRDRGRLERP